MNVKEKAKLVLKEMDKAYRSDMEYGLHQLNEKAREDFRKMYPEMSQAWFFAIDFLDEVDSGKYDT
jgi:hypothetical protein